MQTSGRRTTGFTLIELLVVVAIIAILASLVLMATSSATRKARMAKCRSNLHQIGVAARVYAGDHEGRLPRIDNAPPNAGLPQVEQLPALVRTLKDSAGISPDLYICPSDEEAPLEPPEMRRAYTSYIWNSSVNGRINLNKRANHSTCGAKKMDKRMGTASRLRTLFRLSDIHENEHVRRNRCSNGGAHSAPRRCRPLIQGKLAYVSLNIQTPCPPRGDVPVNRENSVMDATAQTI